MSKKAIIGIATSASQIEATVSDLQRIALVPNTDISILIPDSGTAPEIGTVNATKAPEGATTGAVTGGIAGGTLGLLAGIGALAIPGLGAFIAAGPLLAALSGTAAGATAGGVVGALVGLGIPEYEAKAYEDRIKAGGYLVAVHVANDDNAKAIREVLKNNDLEDISSVSEK
jgi:uncharacterized membrane protein